MTQLNYVALCFVVALLMYTHWFIRDSGIERDLFRNTDEDRQAYLLVYGGTLIDAGLILLALGNAGAGGTALGAGVGCLGVKAISDFQAKKVEAKAAPPKPPTADPTKQTTKDDK